MQLLIFYSLLFLSQIFFLTGFASDINNRHKRQPYGSPADGNCECGRTNFRRSHNRIFGGRETGQNEYPWMALVTADGSKFVGGTLISDRYVVSAAHLLKYNYHLNQMRVILGEHNFCVADNRKSSYLIEKLVVHPEYDPSRSFADILLIKLFKVKFNEFIRPICLPMADTRENRGRRFANTQVTALGWGKTEYGYDVCVLRIVDLVMYPPENCENPMVTVVCAGKPDTINDACSGDSGGPLQIVNPQGKYELLGVVSSGAACGDGRPGFYTDIPQMIPWIKRVTSDSTFCW